MKGSKIMRDSFSNKFNQELAGGSGRSKSDDDNMPLVGAGDGQTRVVDTQYYVTRITRLEADLVQARKDRDEAHNAAIELAAELIKRNIICYAGNEPYLEPELNNEVSYLCYAQAILLLKRN
jgi:hypothetical protein